MSQPDELLFGEYRRVFDERYRIAIPAELYQPVANAEGECVLTKERQGCLSLWNPELWKKEWGSRAAMIQQKLSAGFLERKELPKVQRVSRLISTRSRPIKLGQRGRLLIPEGFREFLGVEANSEVIVVGAGICLEIWNPKSWHDFLIEDIEEFDSLTKDLI